tara:strand:+ start:529 stop:1119 length:591 start_codon:yes stop_codon:yes gene_type:complete
MYDDATLEQNGDFDLEQKYFYYVALNGSIWRMLNECWPDCSDVDLVSQIKVNKVEGRYYFIGKDGGIYSSTNDKYADLDYDAYCKKYFNNIKREKNKKIKNLLIEKSFKMPASDIDAFLKHQNVDEIKNLCEEMYHNGEINRTANFRYFILTDEPHKSQVDLIDVKTELKKFKEMLDDGLIEKEDYDAKKKELLGL